MTSAIDRGRIDLYNTGKTTVFSYARDPRFAYCFFVPEKAATRPGIIVVIHHSGRCFMEARDAFIGLAMRKNQVIVAPLFPADVKGDGNMDGYKYLIEDEIRYDLMLNDMVDTVAAATGADSSKFCIFGFSGGAHFTHRYLLTHPERVKAASIGAPGSVTLLDTTQDWWVGVRDLERLFGRPVNLEALRQVPVQMIVGEKDTETWEIVHAPGSRYYREAGDRAGANRIERLRSMQRSFEAQGIKVRFDVIPGAAHDDAPAMDLACTFFDEHLA